MPVNEKYSAKEAAREQSLLVRFLLKVAVALWCPPAFILIGWVVGIHVAASERHALVMGCLMFFGIGCVVVVIAGCLDADQ